MDLSNTTVFANGGFKKYDDARVGLLTHGLQYGTGCFEGIRGYWEPSERELYLVLLREHYDRLQTSAKILLMKVPHTTDELIDITVELCARNQFAGDVYIRPCIFKSAEDVGVRLHNVPETFAIVPIPFVNYLDAPAGIKACVSSWRRADDGADDAAAPPRAKITGLYVNSALAKSEAVMNGYDEAILLTPEGHVSEGSAENLFLVRRGILHTPDPSQNVLEGCTRRAVMHLAQERLGLTVVERALDRSELYGADEVFLTGTAAGIVHVASIDHRMCGDGSIGPITARLAALYDRVVRGKEPQFANWLTPAYAKVGTASLPV
jgi:branched-chain amino acid aminotransferase